MRFSFSSSIPFCLLLSGCLANPFSSPAPEPELPAAPLSPAAAFIAASSAGDHETLEDANFGGIVDVAVEGSFTSATGKECKRAVVSQPPHEAEIIVICRQNDSWEMMPRVWGRGLD
jgi:hypothetical protein